MRNRDLAAIRHPDHERPEGSLVLRLSQLLADLHAMLSTLDDLHEGLPHPLVTRRIPDFDRLRIGMDPQFPPEEPPEEFHQLPSRPELLGPSQPEMGEPLVELPFCLDVSGDCPEDFKRASVQAFKLRQPRIQLLREPDLDGSGLKPGEVDHPNSLDGRAMPFEGGL